jgi:hypothetical protein
MENPINQKEIKMLKKLNSTMFVLIKVYTFQALSTNFDPKLTVINDFRRRLLYEIAKRA